jgi:hypothetical protein
MTLPDSRLRHLSATTTTITPDASGIEEEQPETAPGAEEEPEPEPELPSIRHLPITLG